MIHRAVKSVTPFDFLAQQFAGALRHVAEESRAGFLAGAFQRIGQARPIRSRQQGLQAAGVEMGEIIKGEHQRADPLAPRSRSP